MTAMMAHMRARSTVLLTVVVALAVATGCGSGDRGRGTSSTPPTTGGSSSSATPSGPSSPRLPKELRLPADVPTTSTGTPADDVSARVIRKWSGALTGGDVTRAARFFALPSNVQNGTPVVTLDTAEKRLVFNLTFPCGAKPTKLERAVHGYTIADFVLLERVGGECGSGTGGTARCAIRVRGGHIADWYRLPARRSAPPPTPQDPGSGLPGTQIS
ncbi:MAG: hypothetical protein JWO02_2288 [Solirubrobacterales bacterium]|nr:hypothetical protein [Solirubrobacterales bacterium]